MMVIDTILKELAALTRRVEALERRVENPAPKPKILETGSWLCPKCDRYNTAGTATCRSEYDTGISCDGKRPDVSPAPTPKTPGEAAVKSNFGHAYNGNLLLITSIAHVSLAPIPVDDFEKLLRFVASLIDSEIAKAVAQTWEEAAKIAEAAFTGNARCYSRSIAAALRARSGKEPK